MNPPSHGRVLVPVLGLVFIVAAFIGAIVVAGVIVTPTLEGEPTVDHREHPITGEPITFVVPDWFDSYALYVVPGYHDDPSLPEEDYLLIGGPLGVVADSSGWTVYYVDEESPAMRNRLRQPEKFQLREVDWRAYGHLKERSDYVYRHNW